MKRKAPTPEERLKAAAEEARRGPGHLSPGEDRGYRLPPVAPRHAPQETADPLAEPGLRELAARYLARPEILARLVAAFREPGEGFELLLPPQIVSAAPADLHQPLFFIRQAALADVRAARDEALQKRFAAKRQHAEDELCQRRYDARFLGEVKTMERSFFAKEWAPIAAALDKELEAALAQEPEIVFRRWLRGSPEWEDRPLKLTVTGEDVANLALELVADPEDLPGILQTVGDRYRFGREEVLTVVVSAFPKTVRQQQAIREAGAEFAQLGPDFQAWVRANTPQPAEELVL